MIKIITTKKFRQMETEIESLRGSLLHLQEVNKGHFNKYQYESGQYEETVKGLNKEIKDLRKELRSAWHKNMELMKKLKKYESRGK